MKTLVLYYSRSGNTSKVANELGKKLGAEVHEIKDTKKRCGVLGYIKGGFDAATNKLTIIEEPIIDPSGYDLVVIGTPVWAGKAAPAIKTYLSKKAASIKNMAFFTTSAGPSSEKPLKDIELFSNKKAVHFFGIRQNEIKKNLFDNALTAASEALKKLIK